MGACEEEGERWGITGADQRDRWDIVITSNLRSPMSVTYYTWTEEIQDRQHHL